jgi:hypothetical protein
MNHHGATHGLVAVHDRPAHDRLVVMHDHLAVAHNRLHMAMDDHVLLGPVAVRGRPVRRIRHHGCRDREQRACRQYADGVLRKHGILLLWVACPKNVPAVRGCRYEVQHFVSTVTDGDTGIKSQTPDARRQSQ